MDLTIIVLTFVYAVLGVALMLILSAQQMARRDSLDHRSWPAIEAVVPKVGRWRYEETLGYVKRIDSVHALMRRK